MMAAWLKDYLAPAVPVLISTWVALLAIRRSDQRERDKQRRDDLTKMLGEFIEIATKLEIKMVKQMNDAAVRHAMKVFGTAFYRDETLLDVAHQEDSVVLRLKGAGEADLCSAVTAYFKKVGQVKAFVDEAVQPGNFEIQRAPAEARLLELRQSRFLVGEQFTGELERLRSPRRLRIRHRFKTMLQPAWESWLKL